MITGSLGRYQIVSQLGRGAMGTVYQALDPAIERQVAIKTLNTDLPQEAVAEMKARFLREAKSAGRLNHPNIVTVYDVGVSGEIPYIAMEFLEGQSLRQLLDSGAPLPFDTIADIVGQIAEGLDYAGRFGIVHRDIKPANIMISPAGLATLTDFGVAYVPSSEMTQTGMALGSPKYMSPEQVLGQTVDRRADIFSLGIVLYEMLMRTTPFERPDLTVYALMEMIVKQAVARVSEQNPAIPVAFDEILARALAKRREERYQRAREFADELRKLKIGAPNAQYVAQAESPRDDPDASQNLGRLLLNVETMARAKTPPKSTDVPAAVRVSSESAQALNEKLRQGFNYLRELLSQINQAAPAFNVELDLIYVGRLPQLALSDGAIDCHTKRIEENEVVDSLTLAYRMSSQQKARVVLKGTEARALKDKLGQAQIKFDYRQVEGEPGAAQFEVFVIESDIVANATLRGDYAAHAVEFICQNVGVLGVAKYRLGIAEIDGAISEFGRLLLGLPSQFAGLRLSK